MNLILASTSPYRAAMLSQLGLSFEAMAPGTKEEVRVGESPAALAARLAEEKATAVAERTVASDTLVLGSDQVASCEDRILGKPGSFDRAFEQLTFCSGKWVNFDTAICLMSGDGTCLTRTERYRIQFRELNQHDITRYLNIDEPWDCAGSIKAEGAGIVLIGQGEGRDINTLYGLPLMLLVDMLEELGIHALKLL